MKSAIYSIAFLAGLAAAQSGKIPSCATSCINEYTTGSGIAGCGQVDVKCICSNNNFLDGIACCLEDACDEEGKNAAVKYAQQICSAAGVDVPDEVVCKESSSTSASGSSTSASDSSTSASGTAAVTSTEDSETSTAASDAAAATTTTEPNAGAKAAAGYLGAALAMLVAV